MRRSSRREPFGSSSGPLARLAPVSVFSLSVALALGFAVLLAAYLATENLLLLVLLIALAIAGTDRLLRLHPEARFHGPLATLLYLPVPALYALAGGLGLALVVDGVWIVPVALAAALIFGMTVNAEHLSVDPAAETYEAARFLLLLVVYIVAFSIFAVVLTAEWRVVAGVIVVGVATFLLTVDILRELEGDTSALVIQAAVVGVVMGESRLAVYYVSLGGLLAAALTLVAFYVITGLVQNQISNRLDRQTLVTYGVIAVAGLAFILGARILGA